MNIQPCGQEKANNLFNVVQNHENLHRNIVSAVRMLRFTLDRAAIQLAHDNADWHDDPKAEDYKDYHASDDVQFPKDARDQAIRDLVDYFLKELKS